jgi:hypothetical protein
MSGSELFSVEEIVERIYILEYAQADPTHREESITTRQYCGEKKGHPDFESKNHTARGKCFWLLAV